MAEGGEKTERATPRQRRKARERGQTAKSAEVTSALSLLALFVTLWLMAPRTDNLLRTLAQTNIGFAHRIDVTMTSIATLNMNWILTALNVLAPFFFVAFFVGLLSQLAQTGILFSAEPLKPDFSRLNPVKGFQRIFSIRGLVELVKNLLKLVVVAVVVYAVLKAEFFFFPRFINTGIQSSFQYSFGIALKIGIWSSVILLILALLDYIYQVYEFEKGIMMTKQEVKDEFKTMEGDPLIKRALREKGREIAFTRMMKKAEAADVVITNPMEYAVALVYEIGMPAPIVVAKGKGLIALRIRRIAEENDIPIMVDPPLARALYRVELESFVPAEHFRAVAQVLAFLAKQSTRLREKIMSGVPA